MDVLIVSQYFYPENFRVNDIALGLQERGHRVTVLTGMPNYPAGRLFHGYTIRGPYTERWKGLEIIRAPLLTRGRRRGVRLALNYLSFALSASIIGPFRCRNNYDVIFVYEVSPVTVGLPAIAMKWWRRIPIVFWVGDLWPETLESTGVVRSPRVLHLVGKLVSFIYRHCNLILVSTKGFVERVCSRDVAPSKVRVWAQWAEAFYERRDFPPSELPTAEIPRGFSILFAGNFGTAQGLETLIVAAERLKSHSDIHFILLGDGLARSALEAEVQRRELFRTVHFLPPCAPERVPAYSSLCEALCVMLRPDPTFALTMPGKMASCLASGKPVLASVEGEAARVIEESGGGLLAKAGDAEDFERIVLALYRMSPEERSAMGQRGVNYYRKHFERESLLSELEQSFRTVQSS